MTNYQLYSTNVFLSGQMKMDLILSLFDDDIMVSDFHLSPINPNIPYSNLSEEQLLNYSHKENIINFHKQIEGYFYDKYIPSELKHNWPIISEAPVKSYDDTYMMGCKRSKYYSLYSKQFEFLCPVWIERLRYPLKFTINIKDVSGKLISSRSLDLVKKNNKVHDKFVNYLYEYMKYIELIGIGDDHVININLDRRVGDLIGINVTDGNVYHKDVSFMVNNLLSRERPVMESDAMIIDCFKNNNMITKQLFNFNLCFNIEDIIPRQISNLISGHRLNIEVLVGDNTGNYPLVDFYTNYEYISREWCGFMDFNKSITSKSYVIEEPDNSNAIKNVYEYLKDFRYIDFMDKNKFSPMIIHWSISDNPDYVFNLYNGFCGISNDGKTIIYHDGAYGKTPDIYQTSYSKKLNNVGWANIVNIDTYEKFSTLYLDYFETSRSYATNFNKTWVNGVKYKSPQNINVILLYASNQSVYDVITHNINTKINDQLLYYCPDRIGEENIIYLISNDLNYLTFKYVKDNILKLTDCDRNLLKLKNLLSSTEDMTAIIFDKSLEIKQAIGPTTTISEVDYIKDDNGYVGMFRYGGKLKPTFISGDDDKFNYIYYKDVLKSEYYSDSIYKKYSVTNYQPLYKSIGYYSIKNHQLDYKDPKKLFADQHFKVKEHKWFNNNVIYNLKEEFNWIFNSEILGDGEYRAIKDMILERLATVYNIKTRDELDYIYNLYEVDIDFDYANKYDINKYVYKVKLILK